jgi:rhodanese-related sulfurtransferase
MQEYIDFVSNHPMLSGAWVIIAVLLIQGVLKSKLSKVKTVNSQEATLLINKQNAVVIDVRTEEEFRNGHIVNAKNITVANIEAGKLSGIEKYKQRPIIVVCATGTRSAGAGNKLVKAGFEQVTSLANGMSGWATANLPTTKK